MEDFSTLQARRQQQALKNRSKAPGAVMATTTPTAGAGVPGAIGVSASAVYTPAGYTTGPVQTASTGATTINFASPAYGTANQAGFGPAPGGASSYVPPRTPPDATAVGFGGPSALVTSGSGSFSSPPTPANTPMVRPAPLAAPTNNPATQMQLTNAQRIAAQLQAFGIADVVMPGANGGGGGNQQLALAVARRGSSEDPSQLAADGADPSNTKRRAFQPVPTDLREFVAFVPRHGLMQCFIKREKSFAFGSGAKYRLYTQKESRFLLSSRKRANKQTSNYLISMDESDMERTSSSFVGKVRANFTGLEFIIYDAGENPAASKAPVRRELGAVLFEQNIGGVKGPRKLKAVIPLLNESDDSSQVWQPATDADSILEEYKRDPQSPKLIVLQNKAPTWNEQLRAYQLNFHGRVTVPSVKNFQLCDARNPSRVVLQFGKCEENRFSLDYQYPLNAFQAFAIAMTSFDNKLACE